MRRMRLCCRCVERPRSSPWSSYCAPCKAAVEAERRQVIQGKLIERAAPDPLGLAPSEPVASWDGCGALFEQNGKRKT